jgi:hypothetical protein
MAREAVVLDLVQPSVARRRLRGFCGDARLNEAGREGTRMHWHMVARILAGSKPADMPVEQPSTANNHFVGTSGV